MRVGGLSIGDLDRKFIIEEPTHGRNSTTSEQIDTWTTFATVWGRWMEASDERYEGIQSVANNESKILIRYLDGVTDAMRVNDSGDYHYIKGIERPDRRVSLVLKTEIRNNES